MRYFRHFCLASLLLTAALAGFNYRVDPYAIYQEYLNDGTPIRVMNERIFKTVKLARTHSDVVFIGSSRTDIGIGREQPALASKQLSNLATFGQPILETRRLFELAVREGKPHTVVIGLDFFAFNAFFVPPPDYVDENYAELRRASLLLSISTLSDSIEKYNHPQPSSGDCCYSNGFRLLTDPAYLIGKYQHYFSSSELMFLTKNYLPYPQCAFSFTTLEHSESSTFDDLNAILKLAHLHHVDLHLFISPSHALQWETLAASGLWKDWEYWKRQLVALNEQSAAETGEQAFPLWDFSGYDEVSSEDLPDKETSGLMKNYSDSSHYTPALGERVVTQLFNGMSNWGVKLISANLESELARIRNARQSYRSTHTRDVADIEALARKIAPNKRCTKK